MSYDKYGQMDPKEFEAKQHEWEYNLARRHEEQFDLKRWLLGMEQKRELPHIAAGPVDPGPAAMKQSGGPAVLFGAEQHGAWVSEAKNPAPDDSLGYAGVCVAVEAKEDWAPGLLAVRFDPGQLGSIARGSLRLFRWDAEEERFEIVPDSQPSLEGDYVFGRITKPGVYGLFGVNTDPLVLPALRMLCAAGRLESALPDVAGQLVDPICKTILCSPEPREALKDPAVREPLVVQGAEQGFFPPPGEVESWPPADICERCLRARRLRLPECQIIWSPHRCSGWCDCWESVGPMEISGCIKQVHIDPTNSDRLYCAAANGGVWVLDRVSTYPTTTWRPISDQLPVLRMVAVAVAPSNGNVIYAATHEAGIYRSGDRGLNWHLLAPTSRWRVCKLLVDPANADHVYAATETAFQESTNGGRDWSATYLGAVQDAAIDPADRSIIYLGVAGTGVVKSAGPGAWNTALDWSSATNPAGSFIRVALGRRNADGTAQSAANRTVVAKLGLEIFVNQNAGGTGSGGWVSKGSRGLSNQLGWDNVLAVDPYDPRIILTGEQELRRSTDGGDTWTTVLTFGMPHEDQQSIAFDPNNAGVVYVSNDGGIFRSTDHGQTWYVAPISPADEIAARRNLNKNLATAEFYRVGVQFNVAVGNLYHSGIIVATDVAGHRWQGLEGFGWEFADVLADPKRPGWFYVFGETLWRRWYPPSGSNDLIEIGRFRPYDETPGAMAVDTRPGSNIALVCAFDDAASSAGHRLMMTAEIDREPYRRPDGTVTNQPAWTAVIDNGADPICSVAFAPSRRAMAYAMSRAGRLFRNDNIDSGTWSQRGQWTSEVQQLAVNRLHPERLYAITRSEVGRSTDGGAGWTPVGVGYVPTSELNSIIVDPNRGSRLYLGADIGVFISDDEGDTWYPFDMGLPNAEVFQIFITGGYLYAVTHGRGLWRRRIC